MKRLPAALPRSFCRRPVDEVARDLLGRDLWRTLPDGTICGGRIVECEAYGGPDDPGSHAFRRTPRSGIMYGVPGVAYIYFTYGMHWCANAVAHEEGTAGAVLIRALEPLEDLEGMASRRGRAAFDADGTIRPRALCSGPAKITMALAIDGTQNGTPLTGTALRLSKGTGPVPDREVEITRRIGVNDGAGRLARYIVRRSDFLSR
jgi:DNA-3-methyladenine glycosylase